MADYLDLEQEVHDLFVRKIGEFVEFCGTQWLMTDADAANLVPERSADWRAGYNAALTDGLTGALDCWKEEIGYE